MPDLTSLLNMITEFIRVHQSWAPLVVFALAFGESLAVVSIFIPATALLLAIGALMEASGIPLLPMWVAATVGASMGDSVSYWIGWRYKDQARGFWPLSRHPNLVDRAEAFFHRFGFWSVAIGRFFGPLRAVVPLVAGILAMRQLSFQVANLGSAGVWAFAMLAPGAAAMKLIGQ